MRSLLRRLFGRDDPDPGGDYWAEAETTDSWTAPDVGDPDD